MTEKRLSMGINVSILLILTIFGVLLFLPLRLLFDTNYDNPDREETNVTDPIATGRERMPVIPMDHRKLRRCPNLPYEDRLASVFQSDYDNNCTYAQDDDDDDDDDDDNNDDDHKNKGSDDDDDDNDDDDDDDDDDDSKEEEDSEENVELRKIKKGIDELMKENAEDILKTRQMKSVTVAGHILVAMLLVSVIVALVEVLRIRFAREKDSSRASTTTSRRCSSGVDLSAPRRPTSRELIRSQRSFEIQGMHRSALRLLGARPPPLIRRSSFPTPQAKQAATSSFCGTPTNQLTRRQSVESDEETRVVTNILHHRIRLIRRH